MCNRFTDLGMVGGSYTSHVTAKLKSSSAKIRVLRKLGFTIIEEITGLVGHIVAIWLPKCHGIILFRKEATNKLNVSGFVCGAAIKRCTPLCRCHEVLLLICYV